MDTEKVSERTARYYLITLEELKNEVLQLERLAEKKASARELKKQFLASRKVYKKVAILVEYFNPVEAKALNRPALPSLVPGTIDKVQPASGFQFIEQELFAEFSDRSYDVISQLSESMIRVIDILSSETNLVNRFSEELVWDALRTSLVQVMSTGIAGFDSPLALHSLAEVAATLDGIGSLLNFYSGRISKNDLAKLISLQQKARSALQGKTFNGFDRMSFIKLFADPLYRKMVEVRLKSGITHPAGNSGIRFDAPSLFTGSYFKTDFYGPPEDYRVTRDRALLGKKLFGDPILSGERNRSCASCHDPKKAFTDGMAKPFAVDNKTLLPRNTPTLWNAGFQTMQFWDSRADILENQLGEVVHNLQEMQGSLGNSVGDLESSLEYNSLFKKAYPDEPRPVNRFTLANAISSYVRSLRSFDSKFDRYISGRSNVYNVSEKRGFNLFMGKAKCGTCHFLPMFNGVIPPSFQETESEVLGVPATKSKSAPVLDPDRGKFDFSKAEIHRFSFKTPTLRNVALTAPYMHNGVFNTLEEVIEFYNEGGGTGLGIAPPNQTLPGDKLQLTQKEKADLVNFMRSLTDTSYSLPR